LIFLSQVAGIIGTYDYAWQQLIPQQPMNKNKMKKEVKISWNK
jgi:hypothetical protein